MGLGARALLVPGLRGREARGEPRCRWRNLASAARFPGRRDSPSPTVPCCRPFHEASSAGCFRRRSAHFRLRRGDYVRRIDDVTKAHAHQVAGKRPQRGCYGNTKGLFLRKPGRGHGSK